MKIKNIILGAALVVAAIMFVSCTVPEVVQNPDGTSTTNDVVDPRLTTGLATGHAVNQATAPVNPFWPVISAALAAVGAVATAVAKVKTDQRNSAVGQLRAVVQTVNAYDKQDLKDAIQDHAAKVGVEGALNKTVKQVESGIL